MSETDQYEYVKATIRDGKLGWEYKIPGSSVHGSDSFDEPVGDYTDQEIIDLTVNYLDVGNSDCIEVIWD